MITQETLAGIAECQRCTTIIGYEKFPSSSHGNLSADYMLLSEAPGKMSIDNGRFWTGTGGRLIRSVLHEFNVELEDLFYLTDVVKCWPDNRGNNRKPNSQEIRNCLRFFQQEIGELKPRMIIGFGRVVKDALLLGEIQMKNAHGKIYQAFDIPLLLLFHPSNINLHMNRETYKEDLRMVFQVLISGRLEQLEQSFNDKKYGCVSHVDSCKGKAKKTQVFVNNSSTFILPAQGNSITDKDLQKGYLRITKDFKQYFPESNQYVNMIILGNSYSVRFVHRGNKRSHLLYLGKPLLSELGVQAGGQVQFLAKSGYVYEISVDQ